MHGTSAIDVIHVDHAIVPTCAQVEVARMSGCSRSCGTGTKGQPTPTPRKPALMFGDLISSDRVDPL